MPRSLISASVIHLLESMMAKLVAEQAKACKLSNLDLLQVVIYYARSDLKEGNNGIPILFQATLIQGLIALSTKFDLLAVPT